MIIDITDGGVQEDFKATFQVGANKGQSMTIDIADMRSEALGITGKAGTYWIYSCKLSYRWNK